MKQNYSFTILAGEDCRIGNNLEQAVTANPVAGDVYTVRVTHKGLSMNSAAQWVSMGISGRVIPASHNFAVSSFVKTNNTWTVTWHSIPGGIYRVEGSADLTNWIVLKGDMSTLADSMQAAFETPTQQNYFFRVARPY